MKNIFIIVFFLNLFSLNAIAKSSSVTVGGEGKYVYKELAYKEKTKAYNKAYDDCVKKLNLTRVLGECPKKLLTISFQHLCAEEDNKCHFDEGGEKKRYQMSCRCVSSGSAPKITYRKKCEKDESQVGGVMRAGENRGLRKCIKK